MRGGTLRRGLKKLSRHGHKSCIRNSTFGIQTERELEEIAVTSGSKLRNSARGGIENYGARTKEGKRNVEKKLGLLRGISEKAVAKNTTWESWRLTCSGGALKTLCKYQGEAGGREGEKII